MSSAVVGGNIFADMSTIIKSHNDSTSREVEAAAGTARRGGRWDGGVGSGVGVAAAERETGGKKGLLLASWDEAHGGGGFG